MDNSNNCSVVKTIDNETIVKAFAVGKAEINSEVICGENAAKKALEELGPKTVRIQAGREDFKKNGKGSGFFVGDDGDIVITNAHVVSGTKTLKVETAAGQSFDAQIIDIDEINDVAALKVQGISKDPSRSVKLGDDRNLKSGDYTFAVGHPQGSLDPVVSQGLYIQTEPYVTTLQEPRAKRFAEAVGSFMAYYPEFGNDPMDFIMAKKVNTDTPFWHGSSGGILANEKGEVVGVTQSLDSDNPYSFNSTPVSKINDLLYLRQPKFKFEYKGESQFDREPGKVLGEQALLGTVGVVARKIAAPAYGVLSGGFDAYNNIKLAASDKLTNMKPKADVYKDAAAGVVGVVGGALSLIPRTRPLGYALVGGYFVYDSSKAYVPDTSILQNVSRSNGQSHKPLFWTDEDSF